MSYLSTSSICKVKKPMSYINIFSSNKKYDIIYADPPWKYNQRANTGKFRGGAFMHYKLLNTDAICNLPVNKLTQEHAALFLWTTFPHLSSGLKVMEAWGFSYKTCGFVWAKLNKVSPSLFFGVGYYTKSNAEVCLLGIKGKMKPVDNRVSSLILSPLRQHSQKPHEARDRIVQLFGNRTRIELFARTLTEGWDIWGMELVNNK